MGDEKETLVEAIRSVYFELGQLGIKIPFHPSELNAFSEDDLAEELDARRNQLGNRRRFLGKPEK